MKRSEGSDRIVLGLVAVLGVLIVGIIALEIIEALMGSDTELGPNTATLMATVAGALTGGIAGYVTQKPPPPVEVPTFTAPAVEPAYDEPDDPDIGSATEAYGVDEGNYEDVSGEFGIQR